MDNLARETKATEIKLDDISGRRVEFVNLSKERPGNWQYVDVDKLEARIRAEETAKWVAIRKREREIKLPGVGTARRCTWTACPVAFRWTGWRWPDKHAIHDPARDWNRP